MILLIFFILLFFYYSKSKSVVLFFILIQVISLIGVIFINMDYELSTMFEVFNLLFTIVILTLVTSPWRKMQKIQTITVKNEMKLKKVTNFLLIVSVLPFVVFLLVSLLVISNVSDINDFKYSEGVADDFYYSIIPFNIKFFILANYLYYFSYFLIPLHFYYLHKGNKRLAFFCFLFSLNVVLYGLTYFSRSCYVHYILLYISLLILFYGTLSLSLQSTIKKITIGISVLMGLYFVSITNSRFDDDTAYEELIPLDSPIQDPALYSYVDYLSQSYYNGMYVLNSYDFKTFNGQTALQPIISLMGQYGLIKYNSSDYIELRQKLWPKHWYTFNGLVAYSVFDFGYIITLVIALLYYYYISKFTTSKSTISGEDLFSLVLFIQIPLFAIFYSTFALIIIPRMFLIPIRFYLKKN